MEMVMPGCFFRVGGNMLCQNGVLHYRRGVYQISTGLVQCNGVKRSQPAQPAHRFQRGSRSKAIRLQSG